VNHLATIAQTTAALRRIRELWGDLLVAIETPAANAVWPPRQLAHTLRPPADDPAATRLPLVLREYPAPVNLTALDAGREIEEALFDLADVLAAACQQVPRDDPRRWHIRTETSPGSRSHGLHWACVWIEGRIQGEEAEPELEWDGSLTASPFRHLSGAHQREAGRVARECERRLLRVLDLDERATPIPDRPCPWCGAVLTLHTSADTQQAVICATGPECTAPVLTDDRGRRVWQWRDLPHLARALDAAGERVRVE
jgi:hypothetical protein